MADKQEGVTVAPAADFYLCEPIEREALKPPPKSLLMMPQNLGPTMPLSISKVLASWKPKSDEADQPAYKTGDIITHREASQSTFKPRLSDVELLFVHATMILGEVKGLVKEKKEEK